MREYSVWTGARQGGEPLVIMVESRLLRVKGVSIRDYLPPFTANVRHHGDVEVDGLGEGVLPEVLLGKE